jgi:hypothetical protein
VLKRAADQTIHLIGEIALGAVALAAVVACVLTWRLAQGPIDVTALLRRELPAGGAHVTVGSAALAWEGFDAADQPLDIQLADVGVATADGRSVVHLDHARTFLSIGQALLGRLAPRSILIAGAQVNLTPAPPSPAAPGTPMVASLLGRAQGAALPAWLSALRRLQIRDAAITVRDPATGIAWQAPHLTLDITRLPNGAIAGSAHALITAGSLAATIVAAAAVTPGGTKITASTTPISPAALAHLSPALSAFAGADLPVALKLDGALDSALRPRTAQLDVAAGAGTIAAGRGQLRIQQASATLVLRQAELRLNAFRLALTPAAHDASPAPVITGSATATQIAGHVHATFGVSIAAMELGELAAYWPAGTGGGARDWMVQNLTQGHAHDAHVEGSLDAASDFSNIRIATLAGGLAADDVTLFWLKPIPPLTHGRAVVEIEGPDSIRISMQSAEQGPLHLSAGSFIRISQLEEPHQVGDIDVGLSGPLPAALALLNHPRLHLLTRSKLEIVDPAGTVSAHMTLHVPLEDRVTIDQIPIAATADLAGVHLGRIAGGYDLDGATLAVKVNDDGLSMTGRGMVAGIEADLGQQMDFRDGPPDQVVQHVTATGSATQAQLAAAGLPSGAVQVLSAGTAGLKVEYTGRRDDHGSLQLDADLSGAALTTPFGWSKPAGRPAEAGALMLLEQGRLTGIENLHASGPSLDIVSRAEVTAGHGRRLLLDRIRIGRSDAHGQIDFPADTAQPLRAVLSGPLLDLSTSLGSQAAKPATQAQNTAEDSGDAKRGRPWTADLTFDRVALARARSLAPFSLQAASDGLRITQARLHAGTHGELSASITPRAGGRQLDIQAEDAGLVMLALGVADNLSGGRLSLDASYNDTLPASPLSGTATLTEFDLRSAPAIGRLLQAMTLYGLSDVLRGPGLHFARLIAPFTWQNRVLHLSNARAFSNSLGLTAQGDIDLRHRIAAITGTVVPAYFFNQLLGDIPVVGKIFSPEKGGGVFAARYSVRGPLADPKVGVNPLSALTPGFLREVFGILGPAKK